MDLKAILESCSQTRSKCWTPWPWEFVSSHNSSIIPWLFHKSGHQSVNHQREIRPSKALIWFFINTTAKLPQPCFSSQIPTRRLKLTETFGKKLCWFLWIVLPIKSLLKVTTFFFFDIHGSIADNGADSFILKKFKGPLRPSMPYKRLNPTETIFLPQLFGEAREPNNPLFTQIYPGTRFPCPRGPCSDFNKNNFSPGCSKTFNLSISKSFTRKSGWYLLVFVVGESWDHGVTEENTLSGIQVHVLYVKLMVSIRWCQKIH